MKKGAKRPLRIHYITFPKREIYFVIYRINALNNIDTIQLTVALTAAINTVWIRSSFAIFEKILISVAAVMLNLAVESK
jgi:hypothetical protein